MYFCVSQVPSQNYGLVCAPNSWKPEGICMYQGFLGCIWDLYPECIWEGER